jgi:hypothetical protein
MDDYSLVGRQKLEQQAKGDLESIRCPLDSAIMMITGGLASRVEDREHTYRGFERYPISPKWTVVSVNLTCSACRRRSSDVPVVETPLRPVSASSSPI